MENKAEGSRAGSSWDQRAPGQAAPGTVRQRRFIPDQTDYKWMGNGQSLQGP